MFAITNKNYVAFALFCIFGLLGCTPTVYVDQPTRLHDVLENSIQVVWSRKDVYTVQSDFRPQMDAGNGLICVLGDIKYPPENAVSCINGVSNAATWEKTTGYSTAIIISPNGVYVSYLGYSPGLEKYDLNGELIWTRTFKGGGIKYFYLYENSVQLFFIPERFLILDAETEEEIEDVKGADVILKTSTEIITKTNYLESKDATSGKTNWSFDISNQVSLKPLFTDKYVIMRTGRAMGTAIVVDRKTGKMLFEKEGVISNVAYLPKSDQIVVIDEDGVVLSVDVQNGKETKLIEFSNPPFFLNGEEHVGGYELAFDESLNFLYVLLGDSRQLYAFQMK